jgi:hypothetical protein
MSKLRYPVTFLIVSMMTAGVALSMGILYLPPGQVTVAHGPWNQGSNSTINITLSSVPYGYDVTNRTYAGWCIEANDEPDVPDGTAVTLLDSTDTEPLDCDPGDFPDVPWDEINYLLNHKLGAMGDIQASVEDIQSALWIVAGTDDLGTPVFPETPEATALVADSRLYGPGYTPGDGNVVAVIICSDGLGPDGWQDTIIEVPVVERDGCTPGFWKQKHHFDSWVPPADPFTTTFFEVFTRVPAKGDLLLAKALRMGGGGEKALLRHGSAAYLNAISPDVDYFFTADEVIAIVQAAYDSGDFEAAKNVLEAENERGCPL